MAHRPHLTILRVVLAFQCGIAIGAAAVDPMEVLQRVSAKVLATERVVPNYTCVETVTREFFEPAASRLPLACSVELERRLHPTPDLVLKRYSTDRLRLDVTLAARGELYSWVGASRFDDAGIGHVVYQGPIATGAFAGFLVVVFRTDTKRISFERSVVVEGRSLMEYSFHVERRDSHYKVKLSDSWFATAYDGTFQADPRTYDVVGMQVQTAELPMDAGECRAITRLDFGTTRIGESEFELPTRTRQRFVFPNGEEIENSITFTNCREFHGETTISYEEAAPATASKTGMAFPNDLTVPPGMSFEMELSEAIDTDTAAAGDAIAAKLVGSLRGQKQKSRAKPGALVMCRLLRVQSYLNPAASVVVVLQPETIEIDGSMASLAAMRDFHRAPIGTKKGMRILLPNRGEEHAAIFQYFGNHVIVKKGLRSDWRTVSSTESAR